MNKFRNAYQVSDPDFSVSPFTGMTRTHYVESAKYLLERAFTHVKSPHQHIIFPTVPGKTYPRPDDPPWRYRSLEFEGLRRTMALAGPAMHVEPDVEINGIRLRDYYCDHILNALTPGHQNSVPLPEDLPDATYQFTCELGGLCMFLLLMPDIIWPYYTREQQDAMAVTLSKWAHHRTTQNNWRFFNIEILSFLKKNGYEIDEDLLKSHLRWIASYHAGDGWYLEQNYNYYTISMYGVYETVWARAFGDEYWPEMADVYEQNTRELMRSFLHLFARNGYINMWSRSICYRLWVAGGFPVAFMLKEPQPLDPGFSRRLCSGSILQFITRDDFYENDIPSLGFYGHREYVLQGYSCAASPFTMFMPYLALTLPADSPFWTADENEGFWEDLGEQSRSTILDNPGLLLANHGKTGTSDIIPAKVNEENHNYNRLSYNTHFPWEDHNPQGITAMEYCFQSMDPRDLTGRDSVFYLGLSQEQTESENDKFVTPKAVFYNGYRDNVLYRQIIMRQPPNNGSGYTIDLADIVIPGGILRVDRCRVAFEHRLNLGHYGLPHIDGRSPEIRKREMDSAEAIIGRIPGRQVALVVYNGWDSLDSVSHEGRNAEADESTVLYAIRTRNQMSPDMELMISAMLHKTDDTSWGDEELFPVESIELKDIMATGSPNGARITMKDGSVFVVDFDCIDGKRMC